MEIHANPWKSMEIYGNPWNSMEIDGNRWNSTKLPWSIVVGLQQTSLRSVCVPLINRHIGRVNDVTDCYNLGKKWIPFINMYKCLPAY